MALNASAEIYTVDLPPDRIIRTKYPMADGVHDPNNELGFVGLRDKLFDEYKSTAMADYGPTATIGGSNIYQLWTDTANISIETYKDKFDFMFIDASHSYENCLNDSYTAHEIVKNGGFIAWHDYNGWPGVTKAINEVFHDFLRWMEFYWLHDTSIVITQNRDK
jgi:hypothetical protein